MENLLEIRQEQTISQSMITALRILSMNAQELKAFVEELAIENPLVDLDAMDLRSPAPSPVENNAIEKISKREAVIEWIAGLDEQNRAYYHYESGSGMQTDPLENVPDKNEETLSGHILMQVLLQPDFCYDRDILDFFINSLDSRGYYTETEEDTARILGISKEEVQRYLTFLKTLDPPGVFSSGPSECLLRQLPQGEMEIEKEILLSCLDLLAARQYAALAKKLHVREDRVRLAEKRIKSLNPLPSRGFSDGETAKPVSPDVTVVKFPDRFEILVNEYLCPSITLDRAYLDMTRQDCSAEDWAYLQDKKQQALKVKEYLSRRSKTLLRLTECIVEAQLPFFLHGSSSLKPFTRAQAAESLSLSESTISRAVKDKYLRCCHGLFPLEYFFSRAVPADDPSKSRSVSEICEIIGSLIRKEDAAHPLRDEELAKVLTQKGIRISRRTVAKYRAMLGIPVWSMRKGGADSIR